MKKNLPAAILSLLLSAPLLIHAQEPASCEFNYGTYTEFTPMPVPGAEMVSGEIGGKFYLTCGFYFEGSTWFMIDLLSVYDPVSDTWDTTGARIPVTRYMADATNSALDGKLYVVGGMDYVSVGNGWQGVPHSRVDVYDPKTDTWELKANLPIPLGLNGICSMDGRLYVSGGESTEQESIRDFYSYDPVADEWTPLTELTTPRSCHVSVAAGGRIYVIGGYDIGMNVNTLAVQSGEVYDPATGQWTPIAPPPVAAMWASACVVDDQIYLFGGSKNMATSNNNVPYNSAYRYSPETDTWTEIDNLPVHVCEQSMFNLGRTIYSMGGRTDAEGWNIDPMTHSYKLSNVCLDDTIPDNTISGDALELNLSEYFSHLEDGEITYSVCLDDQGIVEAEVDGSMLAITGLAVGVAEVSILAESGEDQMGDAFQVNVETPTGIDEVCEIPPALQIYPNPSNGMTTLEYSVRSPGMIRIEVSDLLGKCAAVLLNEYRMTGEYEMQLNTTGWKPGIYFCRLFRSSGIITVKLMLEH